MKIPRWAWLLAALAGAEPAKAAARSADDYLHGGSAKYIQGRLQEAGVDVEEGLRQYPGDTRLKALADQIRKMKDQKKQDQGGQDSQGGDGDKEKQDKQDSSGQGKQGDKDKQDPEKDGEKKEPEDKGEDRDKGQGGDKPETQDGQEGDSTGQDAPPVKPGQMTKEEAERLLNSYQDDEKREQKQQRQKQRGPAEVEEDW
jgi:Ca-activated chloride channel homolog